MVIQVSSVDPLDKVDVPCTASKFPPFWQIATWRHLLNDVSDMTGLLKDELRDFMLEDPYIHSRCGKVALPG
jgi:hypothetical protein